MFSDFPSLHPLVVHFPIVLILLAAAMQGVALWKPHWVQIRWATLIIMGGGFIGSLVAGTVFHAMIAPDAPKEAIAIFEEHEQYAQYTLWMSGFTLLLKSIGLFFKLDRRAFEAIVLAAAIAAAVFVSIAGHHGARLTHVAGVGPMGKYLMKGHDEKGMEGMDMKGDSAMPDMKNMPGMDTAKGMNNMKSTDDMKDMDGMQDMPGMNKNSEMKNMPGMDNMKGMKRMDGMKGMPGMNNNNGMKGMDSMKDMKDMKNMPGMDTTKNMKDMKGMEGMPGMDTAKNMKGMDGMKGMPGMKMKGSKLIDPSKPYDNNPAQEKKKQDAKKQD